MPIQHTQCLDCGTRIDVWYKTKQFKRCPDCAVLANAAWIRKYHDKWYAENKERVRNYHKKYYKETINQPGMKEAQRLYSKVSYQKKCAGKIT